MVIVARHSRALPLETRLYIEALSVKRVSPRPRIYNHSLHPLQLIWTLADVASDCHILQVLSIMFEFRYRPSGHSFTILFYLSLLLLRIPRSSAFPTDDGDLIRRSFYGDPRRNITCLGSNYDLQLPVRHDNVDPNRFTMQQLCAKTIYGGAPTGQHLGCWCWRGLPIQEGEMEDESNDEPENPNSTFDWEWTGVSFDLSDASQTKKEGAHPRLLLGCFNRCFCN